MPCDRCLPSMRTRLRTCLLGGIDLAVVAWSLQSWSLQSWWSINETPRRPLVARHERYAASPTYMEGDGGMTEQNHTNQQRHQAAT